MRDIWTYAGSGFADQDLTGFDVEAVDGALGRVERQVDTHGRQHLVADLGVWVFGKSVLIPAGAVERIDTPARKVSVALTKEQVKGVPPFTTDQDTTEPAYLQAVDAYYGALLSQADDAVGA